MLWLCGFASAAQASDATDFVEGFFAKLEAGDAGAAAACAEPFRSREQLGCGDLVDILLGEGFSYSRGRSVFADDEALVEIWVTSPRERFPLFLVARPSESGWQFEDGTDVDGPKLQTKLSLEGAEDPSAIELPADVAGLLGELAKKKPKLSRYCSARMKQGDCAGVAEQAAGKGLEFRPSELNEKGDRLVVRSLVMRKGFAEDEVWLYFAKDGKRWLFDGIDESQAHSVRYLAGEE
jgi:hypothetical protein